MAKRSQAPGDTTVMKRFTIITTLYFSSYIEKNSIFRISEFLYAYANFQFYDGHVTTFWHPSGAYIYQMPGQKLCRIAESQFSIGVTGLW